MRAILVPPPKMSVTEWALANLVIPPPQTPSPGPFRLDGREYLRDPLDTFSDRRVHHCAVVSGTQCGKTTLVMTGLAHQVICHPTPAMVVLPNDVLGRAWAETRWTPIVRATPALTALIPDRRYDMKAAQHMLGGSIITFIGSNSPANLASRPVRLLILDEVDKFMAQTEEEAGAPRLASERTKAWSGYQIWTTSTPTLVSGPVWQAFMAGDMRRYNVSCPHCSKPVILGWSKQYTLLPIVGNEAWMKWDPEAKKPNGDWDLDRVHQTAHLECPHCQGKIRTEHRARMVANGTWVPTYAGGRGNRSWHISSLYAPSLQCSFGALAVRFLQAKHGLEGTQSFVQNELAEPWEDQAERAERTEIIIRTEDLEVPVGDEARRYLTVDVQAKEPFFWWVIRSWAKDGHSRLVAFGHCDQWEQLAQIQKDHQVDDWNVLIDSGYDASTVYQECLAHGKLIAQPGAIPTHKGWMPAKGRGKEAGWIDPKTKQPRLWTVASAPLERRGLRLNLILFNSDAMRDILVRLRKRQTKLRWELIESAGTDYFAHLDSYVRRPTAQGRRVVIEWRLRVAHRPDHLLDCELMQLVIAMVRGRLPWSYAAPSTADEVTLPT